MERDNNTVTLGFVGDLLVDRDRPPDAFELVRDLFDGPDVLFGNLEAAFTDEPHPAPSGGTPLFPGSHNLEVFAEVGFDVLNLANNHIVDAGHAALLENRDRLRRNGVATVGAGENLAAAREPAIVTANGLRIAFLGYASVFPAGYEARSTFPGLAPFRAYDLWRPAYDNYYVPGVPPRSKSIPDEGDLANLAEDIRLAKQQADLVVASFHWGDFLRPYVLTDHETRTARWCIDAGVDMVVGHHHHALRGMEWYNGKPILYGLGHFVFDMRLVITPEAKAFFAQVEDDGSNYGIFPRDGWPLLPLHPDTRMTALAWATADKSGVKDVGFVPCRLMPDGRVTAVEPDSPEGREVLGYMERCIATQRLNGRVTLDDAPDIGGRRSARIASLT